MINYNANTLVQTPISLEELSYPYEVLSQQREKDLKELATLENLAIKHSQGWDKEDPLYQELQDYKANLTALSDKLINDRWNPHLKRDVATAKLQYNTRVFPIEMANKNYSDYLQKAAELYASDNTIVFSQATDPRNIKRGDFLTNPNLKHDFVSGNLLRGIMAESASNLTRQYLGRAAQGDWSYMQDIINQIPEEYRENFKSQIAMLGKSSNYGTDAEMFNSIAAIRGGNNFLNAIKNLVASSNNVTVKRFGQDKYNRLLDSIALGGLSSIGQEVEQILPLNASPRTLGTGRGNANGTTIGEGPSPNASVNYFPQDLEAPAIHDSEAVSKMHTEEFEGQLDDGSVSSSISKKNANIVKEWRDHSSKWGLINMVSKALGFNKDNASIEELVQFFESDADLPMSTSPNMLTMLNPFLSNYRNGDKWDIRKAVGNHYTIGSEDGNHITSEEAKAFMRRVRFYNEEGSITSKNTVINSEPFKKLSKAAQEEISTAYDRFNGTIKKMINSLQRFTGKNLIDTSRNYNPNIYDLLYLIKEFGDYSTRAKFTGIPLNMTPSKAGNNYIMEALGTTKDNKKQIIKLAGIKKDGDKSTINWVPIVVDDTVKKGKEEYNTINAKVLEGKYNLYILPDSQVKDGKVEVVVGIDGNYYKALVGDNQGMSTNYYNQYKENSNVLYKTNRLIGQAYQDYLIEQNKRRKIKLSAGRIRYMVESALKSRWAKVDPGFMIPEDLKTAYVNTEMQERNSIYGIISGLTTLLQMEYKSPNQEVMLTPNK